MMRNVIDCLCSTPAAKGFSLQLEGSISQLDHFGSGSWGTVPELIAVTDSEIYHLKTLSLVDHVRSAFVEETDSTESTVLEPVQKWIPNFSTTCISGSKNSWSQSFLLSTDHRLFTLNCEEGVRPHGPFSGHGGGSIFGGAFSNTKFETVCVESTSHPQVCLLAREEEVFRKDLRESGHATLLFRSLDRPVFSLHSLSHSNQASAPSHCDPFVVGMDGGILLMDARFVKKCVAQRAMPGDHSMIRGGMSTTDFFPGPCDDIASERMPYFSTPLTSAVVVLFVLTDVFVTAGANSDQANLHAVSLWGGGGCAADERALMLGASASTGPVRLQLSRASE